MEWGNKPYSIGRELEVAGIVFRHGCKEDPRLRTPTRLTSLESYKLEPWSYYLYDDTKCISVVGPGVKKLEP